MQNTYKGWIILAALALFIKIFSLFPSVVEQYYSCGIYPHIADCLHLLFGWVPFSVGDILYLALAGYLLIGLFVFITRLCTRKITKKAIGTGLKKSVSWILVLYIVFNVLWGLNYNRIPMAVQLGLSDRTYTTEELTGLTRLLADSLNNIDSGYVRDDRLLNKHVIFRKAMVAYSYVNRTEPLLYAPYRSLKSSLFGTVMNYIGISGYYNPFTGEAQVNTTVPGFVQPFVTCHEIGHQLGYAKEDEANFAGFLAAQTYPDPVFRYAAFLEMYGYARRELYQRDSGSAISINQQIHPAITLDFQALRLFYKKYENPLDPVITRLYGTYLEANQQPKGIKTYNEVVAMLVAWYKK